MIMRLEFRKTFFYRTILYIYQVIWKIISFSLLISPELLFLPLKEVIFQSLKLYFQ